MSSSAGRMNDSASDVAARTKTHRHYSALGRASGSAPLGTEALRQGTDRQPDRGRDQTGDPPRDQPGAGLARAAGLSANGATAGRGSGRDRSNETGGLLKPSNLPPMEIAAAARRLAKESGEMPPEKMTRAIARLLGLRRGGTDLAQRSARDRRACDGGVIRFGRAQGICPMGFLPEPRRNREPGAQYGNQDMKRAPIRRPICRFRWKLEPIR